MKWPRIGSNRLWKLIKAAFENMGQSRKRAFLWLYLLKKSSRSVTCWWVCSEAFADPLTGIGADLMDIDPNDIDGAYYEKCAEHLQDVMRNEQRKNETAQQKALEKYSELDTPFYLHSGISKDAFDYIEFLYFCSLLFCVWQSQHLLSPENIKRAVTASCEPPNTGINN